MRKMNIFNGNAVSAFPISNGIKIQNKILPLSPGVYLMKDKNGKIIYVGKASSLKTRVDSYFIGAKDSKTTELVSRVRSIDHIRTKTVLEALILEAVKIKEYQPKYNIIQKDDRSFLYLAITREKYPKILLIRGHELNHETRNLKHETHIFKIQDSRFKRVFGPFVSPNALRAALNILRKIFPWSNCNPSKSSNLNPQTPYLKSCFDYHLKLCPGVCIGAISSKDYKKIIRGLILFFEGKKVRVLKDMKREMLAASRAEDFEVAAMFRNRIYHLENIRDISVLTRDMEAKIGEDSRGAVNPVRSRARACASEGSLRRATSNGINIFGRIEGYDISNISGTSAVGSMVVFLGGEPAKSEYRKFKIKTVKGANDVAMLREVLTRRFSHNVSDWPLPDIILIDGGVPQVNVARRVLEEYHLGIPIIGIAKGIDRKKDELILPKDNPELQRIAKQFKNILVRVRDEAHRFAISFYRRTHRRKLVGG